MKTFIGILVTVCMLLPVNAEATSDPRAVVQSAVDGVIQVLGSRPDKDRLRLEDRQAIRAAINKQFDFREMGKRSLGRSWKKINSEQRDRFVDVFRELLERSYGNSLASYKGQTVEYGDVRIDGKRARVETLIKDESISIPVQYSLKLKSDHWRVYDIRIEGLSLVSTFRTDFKALYKQDGYDGLIQKLETKIQKLKKQDQGA
ncbi:MAG: phospholipid-binding protein MlaC [Mariprofundaceae bacterium]